MSVTEEFNPERVQTVLAIPSKGGNPKTMSSSMGTQLKMASNQGTNEEKISQKRSQKIFEAISANPEITTQELAEMLGISRRAVAKHIAVLQASGRILRIGPDKGGHWEVVEKSE